MNSPEEIILGQEFTSEHGFKLDLKIKQLKY